MTTSTTPFPALASHKVVPVQDQRGGAALISGPVVDQQSGRALVILGHAIEYLADKFVHEGGTFTANRGQVEAIQILMAVNRKIYLACPEVPTFGQWLYSILRGKLKFGVKIQRLYSGLRHGRI